MGLGGSRALRSPARGCSSPAACTPPPPHHRPASLASVARWGPCPLSLGHPNGVSTTVELHYSDMGTLGLPDTILAACVERGGKEEQPSAGPTGLYSCSNLRCHMAATMSSESGICF